LPSTDINRDRPSPGPATPTLWTIGLLPYADTGAVTLVLQDTDTAGAENLQVQILTKPAWAAIVAPAGDCSAGSVRRVPAADIAALVVGSISMIKYAHTEQ
jgi:hypothetical protein